MRKFEPKQMDSPGRVSAQNLSEAIGRGDATRARLPLFAISAALFAAQLLVGFALAAQTSAIPAPANPSTHPQKKPSAAKLLAQPASAPPMPAAPPIPVAPPLPNWPANKKAAVASVVWDSQGLFIQASNSSLDQILKDVSLKIGAKVEGMGADERVFGTYGPGPAREVLDALLDGSGYNILMIGEQGEGTPRRIVLSGRAIGESKPSGNANPGANNENDGENDQGAQQPPEPEGPQPGEQQRTPETNPGQAVPVRTPQDLMQQRQQQMQQMQQHIQQQQQNNPQN